MIKPWLLPHQIFKIKKYIKSTDTILEYGSGGSTLEFSKYCKKYYSIEHDFNWYNDIKKHIGNNTFLYHVPPDNDIKLPVWLGNPNDFMSYIQYVHKLPEKIYDCVIIDGRVRVNCAKEVLEYINGSSLVFFHDFERQRYHSILNYYTIYDRDNTVPSLAILVKK